MTQREIQALTKRLHKHAKNNCATHAGESGCHVMPHGKCLYSITADRVTANVCPYFIKSVVPSNHELYDDYMKHFPDGYPLKDLTDFKEQFPDKCERCKQRYKKSSNRQKYCERCRGIVKNEQAKARMKRKRLSS